MNEFILDDLGHIPGPYFCLTWRKDPRGQGFKCLSTAESYIGQLALGWCDFHDPDCQMDAEMISNYNPGDRIQKSEYGFAWGSAIRPMG